MKLRHNRRKKIISEINVTPFVDILLIILIIFMVTAPMLNTGFEVNLPESSPNTIQNNKEEKVVIAISNTGDIYIDKKKVAIKDLVNNLTTYNKENVQVLIQADKDAKYQNVISVMSVLNQNGYANISLVTDGR